MPLDKADLRSLELAAYGGAAVPLQQQVQRTRQGRWKMLVLLLVCAAPVVASYFTYYVIRPEARRNFGALIEPQKAIPEGLIGQTLQGHSIPLADLQGQWLLVSTSEGACNTQCEQHLYLQRQLRESLGREKARLDWVWLISDGQDPPSALQAALEQAQVLKVADAALRDWLPAAQGQQVQDHLYVVDPLGHLMMRFPAHLDASNASKAKRDLERLLRASASWHKPGR